MSSINLTSTDGVLFNLWACSFAFGLLWFILIFMITWGLITALAAVGILSEELKRACSHIKRLYSCTFNRIPWRFSHWWKSCDEISSSRNERTLVTAILHRSWHRRLKWSSVDFDAETLSKIDRKRRHVPYSPTRTWHRNGWGYLADD